MSEYTINLKSSILAGPTDLSVIVPGPEIGGSAKEFYGSGNKYKVLWLLHAGSGDRNDWLRSTSIGRFVKNREVMVVIPNALNSDFANHPQFADEYNYSDFFFDELMPFIFNWLPASDQPKDNFIAGFSMGAAGAWMYGLYRPEKFGGVAPISSPPKNYTFLEPHRNMTSGEFRARATADNKAFPTAYGDPKSGIKVKGINMIAKYPTVGAFLDSCEHTWDRFREVVAAGRLPNIYLPCGTEDRMYQKILQVKQYAEELGAKGITYDFIAGEGGGFGFCDYILPKMMDFFNIK
jgi:S-formylglutathione hydrolase FrmB